MSYATGNAYTWMPACWFRLARVGDRFYTYESPDGVNWHYVHSTRVEMPEDYLAGLTAYFKQSGAAELDRVTLR
jgi:hypothetical protein